MLQKSKQNLKLGKIYPKKKSQKEDIWIKALKAEGEKEMEELLKNNKELREMKEELERITADPELREKYYYREKQLRDELSRIKDGYMKGIKEGKKEGIEENRKEIVLYNIPIDVDTIEKGYPILCA